MTVSKNAMRRYLTSLVFAGSAFAASPVFAAPLVPGSDSGVASVAVQRVRVPLPGLREEAAMVLVGTALIGLAAAVRRAS
jgi:hypothetical protein